MVAEIDAIAREFPGAAFLGSEIVFIGILAFLKTAEKTVESLIGSKLKSIKGSIAFSSSNSSPTEAVNCYRTCTQGRFASLGFSASLAFLLAFRSLYL